MKLVDAKLGHFVGSVTGQTITSRHGDDFFIEGYAVVDIDSEVVGTYDNGKFYNNAGVLMAVAEASSDE